METGRILWRPVFIFARFLLWRKLVAVPAAEAIVVAAGKGFAPLVAPVVRARGVEAAMGIFTDPIVIVADDAIAISIAIPLAGLGVGCTGEEESASHNDRS